MGPGKTLTQVGGIGNQILKKIIAMMMIESVFWVFCELALVDL